MSKQEEALLGLVARWTAAADDLARTGDYYESCEEAANDACSQAYRECAEALEEALKAPGGEG